MPKVDTTPDTLRPYLFHGLDLGWKDGDKRAVGDCPWCGRERKFSVDMETGQWRCLVCGEGTKKGGGNLTIFLRMLLDQAIASTPVRKYDELVEDRGLLFPETVLRWQAAISPTTGKWLVPGWSTDGRLVQLYQYVEKKGKRLLMATPTIPAALFGINLFKSDREPTYQCEGPWDAMTLWELIGHEANVIAVPGCSTFHDSWSDLLVGHRVVLAYDSDHPRTNAKTGSVSPPAGHHHMRRVVGILAAAKAPPVEIKYVKWGEEGYDPDLPSGYDVRDALKAAGDTLGSRRSGFAALFARIYPVPEEWLLGEAVASGAGSGTDLECLPCSDWKTLVSSWRKALRWTDGLDHALAAMLAVVTSTKLLGDQLWAKIVAPPSTGKSTLCEALSVCREYVVAKSTIRGFHSGYKSDKSGEEDHSLIETVRGKTLVIKDGDTLLQSPNLSQILSEMRDLYDCTSRAHYRHGLNREYAGIRMTVLLCGTDSLRQIDASELGERFLDVVIMDEIDDELEDEINWRKINQVDRNMGFESDGKAATHQDQELTEAMQLTGGYVDYLRRNAAELLSAVEMPDEAKRLCMRLGKFVSYMRARPSERAKMNEEKGGREFSPRLVSQHGRMAKCLAAVLGKQSVDDEVMKRVRRVAFDTARGLTLDVCRCLVKSGDDGVDARAIALAVMRTDDKARHHLRFLRQIGVVESFQIEGKGLSGRYRWRLTTKLRKLYEKVIAEET